MAAPATSAVWPRNCSILGTDKFPSLAGVKGTPFGMLQLSDTSSDYFIYATGTPTTVTPRWGNSTQVGTTGGVALSTAINKTAWDPTIVDNVSIFGTERPLSAATTVPTLAIISNSSIPPALGLMFDQGIQYLYQVGGQLCLGTEAQWLASSIAGVLVSTAGTGHLSSPRLAPAPMEGTTIFSSARVDQSNISYPVLVVQSGGKGAGFGFLAADQTAAAVMYYDRTKVAGQQLVFGDGPNWVTWTYGP